MGVEGRGEWVRENENPSVSSPPTPYPLPSTLSPSPPTLNPQPSTLLYDAVLIDDDPLVHLTWKIAAKRAGKNLLAFRSAEEFLNKVTTERGYPRSGSAKEVQKIREDFLSTPRQGGVRNDSVISTNTPIYIDSRLGNGVKGEEESLKIHALGFQEIYLATGDSPEKFAHLKHIRGVLGKEPPWVGTPA